MDINATKKPFWALSAHETFAALKSTGTGLSQNEAKERLSVFGKNVLEDTRTINKIKIFLSQFKSPLIFILIAAGGVTLFLSEWIDASVIFLALIINAILGFYQENRAEEALARLKLYIKERTRAVRDGKEEEIDAETIVPGDVLHLSYGMRVPADARIISAQDFSVDESILTGESMPILKTVEPLSEATPLPEQRNMVFGGTLVVEGYARVVTVATGRLTEIGKIAALVAETKRQKTPLQTAVGKLAWIIAGIASLVVLGIFTLGISRGEPFFEMFLISAAVAVGAIPEALPIALTVVLAVGVEQLAKRKGIVRNLAAAETLGSTTLIMTDKTGTLTKAEMHLVDVATGNDVILGKTKDHKPIDVLSSAEKDILRLSISNVNVLIENPSDPVESWRLIGRPLEVNIVRSAAHQGINVLEILKENAFRIILPFNSKNKFSAAIVSASKELSYIGQEDDAFIAFLGAPDVIIKKSKLTKEEYVSAMNTIESLSNDGKRVLGFAIKPLGEEIHTIKKMDVERIKDLLFLGILAFYDPVRKEIPEAITRVESYGIKVVMATGDLKGTAISVAKQLGWRIEPNEVLTGEELAQLNDQELLEHIDKIKIFARVTPEDKLRIGRLYKQKREIVGMTGDGVNDAPSLKAVDIGIAVGSGSDVAKDVADLVLLDDDFDTIVAAIEEGKRILGNIRKSFVYLMSNSLDEVVLVGSSLLVGLPLPLTALQIIWVNFFTGSLPALSFAFDDHLDGDGRSESDKKILNAEVKFLTLGVGVLTSILLFVLYWGLFRLGVPEQTAKTFLFACFSSYILFIAFSFRSLKHPIFSYNIFSNTFLTLGVGTGIALIAATIYLPPLQKIFETVPLSPFWLLLLLGWITINVALVEIAKWIFRSA